MASSSAPLVAVQCGKKRNKKVNSYIFLADPDLCLHIAYFLYIIRIRDSKVSACSVLCVATLQSSAGAAGPLQDSEWRHLYISTLAIVFLMLIGTNRKTLCMNRVLISLLPRYSIMKHSAYFCRKFGKQLFLVVTEQAGV